MIDLYDSIEVLEFPKVIFNKLIQKKIYFVVDLICLKNIKDKDTLNMISALKKQLVEIVHSKGLFFIDELPIEEQMELILLIDEKKKGQKIEYIDDVKIENMGLSDRVINILIQNNIKNLSDIVNLDVSELQGLKLVGEFYCQEIINKVHSYGVLFPNESVKGFKTIIKVRNSDLNAYKDTLELNYELLRNSIMLKYGILQECKKREEYNKYLETVSSNLNNVLYDVLSLLEKDNSANDSKKEKALMKVI